MPKKARERWQRSPTPVESWSDAEGANSDGEWEIQIIGEEVDEEGNVRYEAEWVTWSRMDGTNTTWDNDLLQPRHHEEWDRIQAQRRLDLAKESHDIEIWATLDIYNTNTRLRAQAYDEKLKATKRSQQDDLPPRMAELMASQAHLFDEPASEPPMKKLKTSTPRTQNVKIRSSSSVGKWSPSITSSKHSNGETSTTLSVGTSSSSRQTTSTLLTPFSVSPPPKYTGASSSNKGKGKRVAASPGLSLPPPSPISMPMPSNPRTTKPLPSRSGQKVGRTKSIRERLEERWNKASNSTAPITFANDIDDEQVPAFCENFEYLESVYNDPNGFQVVDPDFLVRCDCDVCIEAMYCDCQSNTGLVDERGHRAFAYTVDGLFAFNVPPGDEVIECNKCCSCDMGCQNRVTQQPRNFSIQIFKTPDRGWGVRSMEDIPRGKVLGLYTGLLMTRKAADDLGRDRRSYCFDLDGQEIQDDSENDSMSGRDEGYTVDSQRCGNWTRFINHSCGPNLEIYLVLHDAVPDMGLHYIAFVATEPIMAMTEFTFDYDPKAAVSPIERKGKGKGKVVIPPGCRQCFCGSSQCRQYLKV